MCEVERGTGAREIHPSLDEMNKMRSKKSKGFSGRNRKFKSFFRPKTDDLRKKKRSASPKRHKIRCQSTKNTNLDLDLRSRSPDPVNFFGAQSSLGGAQFSFGGHKHSVGGHGPRMPPRGAGSASLLPQIVLILQRNRSRAKSFERSNCKIFLQDKYSKD